MKRSTIIFLKKNYNKPMEKLRHLILLITFGFTGFTSFCQPARMERVHALKVAYITEQLGLSAAQAERFWPVYNQYERELRTSRQQFRHRFQKEKSGQSEEEAREFIEENLDFQEAMLQTRRKYKDEFLKIISAQQLADLYIAEREFKQKLIQRLRKRKARRN
jgi:hypothetical protein